MIAACFAVCKHRVVVLENAPMLILRMPVAGGPNGGSQQTWIDQAACVLPFTRACDCQLLRC